jgi:hypothetical protein
MKRNSFTLLLLFAFLAGGLQAAEWQWSVSVDTIMLPDSSEQPRAFLWIPPDCRQVRGVVFGQNNMIEEGILEHPYFRGTLTRLGFAEIYIAPTFDYWQNAANNAAANERFVALLKSLAGESGYDELRFAPVVPLGHSAMASFPWNFAAWNPERTLAILSIHGDAPQTDLVGNGRPNVDWNGREINGIPGLMVMGEYEWWERRLAPALRFHAQHPATPLGMLADVGHGHFDYSDELVRYLALFVRKSTEQRLPANQPLDRSPALKPVDPKNGWLTDRWNKNGTAPRKAAPFAEFSGDTNEAFWCFDREMAQATINFNSKCGNLPQLVGFKQDGVLVPETETHQQVNLKFEPEADGITFKLSAAFYSQVPGGSPNLTNWTGLPVGAPLGHATGGGPIQISRISGPVVQLSADTFSVCFNRSSIPADRRAGDIWLLASHPGDARYRSAVQQALLKIPIRLADGSEQHIAFPQIPDQKVGAKSVRLNASSDSGARVHYYVREGPAEIDGDELKFTAIPPRARFPVKVTVVAWQYGRSTEPKLRTAKPVDCSFFILKP